ncbi:MULTISPECIES: diguanylate cyclase domain-containing protein [unclassified Shewanella]|uniref:GGDEF domain-containing protein n=1 Tax=unclassified Shewanella TaxID=196818 RepID=UPI001BBA13AE|nr:MULTISPECIES: diguanylate cyclase [unclassified Shewanella]GIU20768.1 GGDEF domain-containing protein [Shewanella sp. MBTL60-112-B1]GIU29987.1 GGDEF domain-containing protein [Shewanella sp. MBTL60-112-B2]
MGRVNIYRAALALTITFSLLLSVCLMQAQLKPQASIDIFDIATEGSLLILGLSWLIMVLQARPDGHVTRLLIIGLIGYSLGCYMDLLDEFFINNSLPGWFSWVEKLPTPIGLLTLTLGLWLWREEQKTVNEQLRTREQFFRQHQLVDRVTKIYDSRAIRHQLSLHIKRNNNLGLLMLDIDNFADINQQQGFKEGDILLTNIAQLLATQLRSQDLVCRYAGDSFIVLLPQASEAFSYSMATELQQAIKALNCQASCAVIQYQSNQSSPKMDANQLIELLNTEMEKVKLARTMVKVS